MHMLHSLLPTLPPWLSFLCPYLVVWGTLLAFKSISSMGINKVELNMSWSRYEDVKAVWHLFSHSEMKYNVLIPNASDRINCNDLRFPPGNSAQNHPSTHTPHARAHTNTRRWCSNWLGWGGKSWRTQQQLTHSKHNLCSLESAVTCGGGKTVVFVSVVCWLWRKM